MDKIRILIFITFSNICFAQSIDLNQGNALNENYYSKIKFEYVNGKIIIPVKINNNTYRFLLDTGAPNCISKNLNNIIKPKILQETKVSDSNNNESSMDVVELPDLIIGDIVFKNSIALSYKVGENLIFDCLNIDGFIGSNLLRNSIIQIDIKNQTLIISNEEKKLKFNKKNNIKLALIGKQSSPYIWIKLKGKNAGNEQVLLDTGMAGFYDLSNRNYNLFKNENIFKITANGSGTNGIGLFGTSTITDQLRIFLPEMQISNSKFVNISTITTNDNNSRLGIELFENGIATLDYKNKRFYYDQYQNNTDLNSKQLGFSPTLINNKLSIGIVWDDNRKEIITVGDQIIEINGENYENYPICDLISKETIFKSSDIKVIIIKTKNGELKKLNL